MEELIKESVSLEEELNTLNNDSVSKKKSQPISHNYLTDLYFCCVVIHAFTIRLITILQMTNSFV